MEIDSHKIDACLMPEDYASCNYDELNSQKNGFHDVFDVVYKYITYDDCKSMIFLLMDNLAGFDDYINLSAGSKSVIIKRIREMDLSEEILIELLGTLKIYSALNYFNTCKHIFEIKKENFQNISKIWKVFYAICEEIAEEDLNNLLNFIPECYRNQIQSAEDWFVLALKCGIMSKFDVSKLVKIFQGNSKCLNLIHLLDCHGLKSYKISESTRDSHCGIALIISYESFFYSHEAYLKDQFPKRTGSAKDVDSLKKMWFTYGFKPVVWENLTKEDTLWKIKHLAKSLNELYEYEAFVCCILSHGYANVFYSSDCQMISIKEFIASFCENVKCLVNKPKLFFIQACQGPNILYDSSINYCASDYQHMGSDLSASTSEMDILIVVATINGFVSFRHSEEGSLFVQSLCKIMGSYGSSCSILDIVTQITDDVSKHKISLGARNLNAIQIPPTYQTLRKKLIFKRRQS